MKWGFEIPIRKVPLELFFAKVSFPSESFIFPQKMTISFSLQEKGSISRKYLIVRKLRLDSKRHTNFFPNSTKEKRSVCKTECLDSSLNIYQLKLLSLNTNIQEGSSQSWHQISWVALICTNYWIRDPKKYGTHYTGSNPCISWSQSI